MPLLAVAFPILPGKTPEWRAWMDELNGPRREEFVESRRRAGVHERTFLQSTPMGDLVIVTLEGDDPVRAFGQMWRDGRVHTWFIERATAVHGIDAVGARNRVAVGARRGHGQVATPVA